jgi:antitoxin component of MazEF toxin-antitoxin module
MPKATVRRDRLTIPLSADILEKLEVLDGDELEVTSEGGRIVLTPAPEEPLPGELEALDEAEQEFAKGKTRRLDDVLHGLGRKVK